MRIITLITLFFFNVAVLSAQPFNVEAGADGNSPKLLGKINKEGLSQTNYAKWFNKNFDDYTPDQAIVDQIKDDLTSYTIELFMGTWCGDSKREVPRFYKVLEAANFPMERLTSIAVDRDSKAYKQSPGGEHEGKNIHRVPTFIFYKNGVEINRITEHPVSTLEEDILNILQDSYTPNYHGVSVINEALNELGLEKFSKKEKKITQKLQPLIKASKELSTYSYVLYNIGKTEEAIVVARINVKLFPSEASTYTSLANRLKGAGNATEALTVYKEALKLDPENTRIKDAIAELKSSI